ncbi:MAG: DHHA1 domain-containing protein [Candidatus Heimdallarchaeota archaeon]
MSNPPEKADYKGFQAKIKETVDFVRDSKGAFLCISHIDADGLSAAGIIGKALHREGINYHVRSVRQLELPIISEISMMKGFDNIIFSDLGGGQMEGINKYLSNKNIVILDHHPTLIAPATEKIINISPFDFGFDGSNQVSGAGISYFIAKQFDKANIDSSPIAIVGALADRQDKGKKNSLIELNKKIVQDGVKADILEEKLDIRLFGRETRPIYQALEYTTDPFLPGLTGDGDMCIRFMRDTGIAQQKGDQWRTIDNLTEDERKNFVQQIIQFSLAQGGSVEDAQGILGYVYTLKNEQKGTLLRDAREFGSLLNSCGRLGATGVAIGICMGERKFLLQEAGAIMTEYRKKIASFLTIIGKESEHIKEYSNITVFDGRGVIDDTMIGTITSIAISTRKFSVKGKPLMGMASSEDGTVKVSCRGTAKLIQIGLDLGLALREAVKAIGSEAEGGGHNIAAGARIPKGTEKLLIEALNEAIEKQIHPTKEDDIPKPKSKPKSSSKTTKTK